MLTLTTRFARLILPVVGMVSLIPFVTNDFLLAFFYLVISAVALALWHDRRDLIFFLAGFVFMFMSEYLFLATGVETFQRASLLGVMPVWLPILWAYAFVVIRRAIVALDHYLD